MNDVDKLLFDLVVSVAGGFPDGSVLVDPLNPALLRSVRYLANLGLLVADESDDLFFRISLQPSAGLQNG